MPLWTTSLLMLLQDTCERVLTAFCCWRAALMLEGASLRCRTPEDFAQFAGLQPQQSQRLQDAVMAVLAWGEFDGYLQETQRRALAAAAGRA